MPLGLIPNEYKTAFLLGMFDGDGNFSCSSDYSTDVTIGLTSYHKEIAEEFQLEIDKLIDKKIPNKIRYTDAWHVNWRGRL